MDGIVILDKESGVYSRKAGARVARMFGEKKFGHIGTLDPMATGVLLIALGRATKMIPLLKNTRKTKKNIYLGCALVLKQTRLILRGRQ